MNASTLREALPGPWLAAIAVSALAAMTGAQAGLTFLVYLFKPLCTALIIALAATGKARQAAPYRGWLVAGLLASLAGDLFLMLPGPYFIHGLVSFLLAHLCYLRAFAAGLGRAHQARSLAGGPGAPPERKAALRRWAVPMAAYVAVCVPLLMVLVPRLPVGLTGPVLAYVACLALMAACAWGRHRDRGEAATALAAFGGAFFVCSDALLAFNKFHTPLPLASFAVLSTYWIAQTLLALSARR